MGRRAAARPDALQRQAHAADRPRPLPLLLDSYREYGPVFSMRILHASGIFMLGPEANHYILVENAANFRWRDGGFVDLIPLLGDGMLTIDGDYHRRARRIMLPPSTATGSPRPPRRWPPRPPRALDGWAPGAEIDIYHWTRALALRIAMRALFGFDPDRSNREFDVAEEFERALSYYGRDYFLQSLRGPGTPWKRMHRARRAARSRDLRGDRAPARRGATSARTSSRCSCRPAMRTAAPTATASCATS